MAYLLQSVKQRQAPSFQSFIRFVQSSVIWRTYHVYNLSIPWTGFLHQRTFCDRYMISKSVWLLRTMFRLNSSPLFFFFVCFLIKQKGKQLLKLSFSSKLSIWDHYYENLKAYLVTNTANWKQSTQISYHLCTTIWRKWEPKKSSSLAEEDMLSD